MVWCYNFNLISNNYFVILITIIIIIIFLLSFKKDEKVKSIEVIHFITVKAYLLVFINPLIFCYFCYYVLKSFHIINLL